uniref:AarF domain-containing protein kinase 1 n=1 Tax=Molossus molossus TaxID=27622 RepID=A0A7J8JPL6_MOLMO|nr:aarF domain containing kinase 1 [Molossus molossus]
MARRALKLASWTSMALAASGVYLYSNKYLDPNDFGAVRVGRAVATTAVITYDYLTTLRSVPYGSEDYLQLLSEIHDLFMSFDDTPLGAASLAQVHKAVLHDGRTVAVKVQHPKVQVQSSKDILLMEVLVLAIKQLFPDFEFVWLVDEAKKNLPLELDFLNEGRNAEKVAQMLKHFDFLKVPQIYWELSTKRVLLMEFLDGGQVNDKDYMERNKIDVNEISRHLGKVYSEMVFVNGFVHCDPHPGNVLVRKHPDTGKAEIVLLDHGLYQVLTEEFRLDYCHLWQSLIWTDMESVKKYSQRLGAGDLYPLLACMLTARSWSSVNRGISQAPVTATEDSEIRNNAATYLPQISQLLNHVPRPMLLIFKTNDLLRGIETTLGTRASASSFLNMSRCCIRALAAHNKKNACSFFRRTQFSFSEAVSLWQISLHELILRAKALRLAGWVSALLHWLLPAPR